MVDFRKFLDQKAEATLPFLGGITVHAPDRRLRVTERPALGWWRWEIKGRNATPTTQAEAPPMDDRPRLRGHVVGHWLFTSGNEAELMLLCPEEETPTFTPGTARRWHSRDALFEGLEFEDEPEMAARAALEAGTALGDVKGVHPSLRAAFGFATVQRAARDAGLRVSPREVLRSLPRIAVDPGAAATLLQEVEARRYQVNPAITHRVIAAALTREHSLENAEQRAAEVLDAAGATLTWARYMGGRNLEVSFRFDGENFKCVVDWESLHVYDAGICLQGQDEQLGLDALPAVIREAIAVDILHITLY